MIDRFDRHLLNLVQRNSDATADSLARDVPLSSSAIARRLRRLRSQGLIARCIALLSTKLAQVRLRAVVMIVLKEHADVAGKAALAERLIATDAVQWAYEISGAFDIIALIDCPHMGAFNEIAERIIVADPAVRRYETSFVKNDIKFAPFVDLQAEA